MYTLRHVISNVMVNVSDVNRNQCDVHLRVQFSQALTQDKTLQRTLMNCIAFSSLCAAVAVNSCDKPFALILNLMRNNNIFRSISTDNLNGVLSCIEPSLGQRGTSGETFTCIFSRCCEEEKTFSTFRKVFNQTKDSVFVQIKSNKKRILLTRVEIKERTND